MFHPRSSLLWFACATLGVFATGGCSSSFYADAPDMLPFNTDGGVAHDAAPGPAYDVASDAATPPSLCGDPSTCNPDESTGDKMLALQCVTSTTPDSGKYADGGGSAANPACRLNYNGKTVVATCGAAGSGHDGDACTSGSDCSAGFECVSSPGRCRHYCCDPSTCKLFGQGQSNDTKYFCDVQTQTASNVNLPACLPVQACKLLVANSCSQNQTCSIVDVVTGTTSCVQIGRAKVGESCETAHCGANLVCLGSPGKRSCQQLCDPSQTSVCPTNLACKQPWQILIMDGAGICQ